MNQIKMTVNVPSQVTIPEDQALMAGNAMNWRGLMYTLNEWTEAGIQDTNPEAYRLLRQQAHLLRGPARAESETPHYPLTVERYVEELYEIVLERERARYEAPPGVTRQYLFKLEAVNSHDDLAAQVQQQQEYLRALDYTGHLLSDGVGYAADSDWCNTHSITYWYPPSTYYAVARPDAEMRTLLWLAWQAVDYSLAAGYHTALQSMLVPLAGDLSEQAIYWWKDYYQEDQKVLVGGVEFARVTGELGGPRIHMLQVERKKRR